LPDARKPKHDHQIADEFDTWRVVIILRGMDAAARSRTLAA
jgi:hypothetical protein